MSSSRMKKQNGQSMTEYVLLVALIAIAVIAAVKFFGHSIANNFSTAAGATNSAVQGAASSASGH